MLGSFNNKTPSDVISATLLQDGGVIVLNQAADDLLDNVAQELREPLDAKGHEFENDFNGYKTRRLAGDVVGFGVSLVTIFIVTLLTQKIDPPRALADEHGVPINLKGRLGIG